MDLDNAKAIIDTLYADVDGYGVSNMGRNANGYRSRSFTYGEITPEAFQQILADAEPPRREVFYDLGSGTGKAVLLARLLERFPRTVGIELVDTLYDTAVTIAHRYETEFREATEESDQSARTRFVLGNFLEQDLSDADVIFAHSTCFDAHIMAGLEIKLGSVRPGTRIITVTKDFLSPVLRLVKRREYAMSWGKSTVHFYEKINP